MKQLIVLLLLCFPCANINWAQLEIDANKAAEKAAKATNAKYDLSLEAALTNFEFDLAGFEKDLRETLKKNRKLIDKLLEN